MKPTTKRHLIYRNSGNVGDFQAYLKDALDDFYQRYQQMPGEIVVHSTRIEKLTMALAALEMSNLPVTTTGGCLTTAIWFGQPVEQQDEKSS